MQIIISYSGGYDRSIMIGKKHFDIEMTKPAFLVDAVEDGNMKAAYNELIKMIRRIYMKASQFYTLICVVNAKIYRVMFAVDGAEINYEYIDEEGCIETGRFTA